MAKMCPGCGTMNDDNANNCGNCGANLNTASQPQMNQYQQPQMNQYQQPQMNQYQQPQMNQFQQYPNQKSKLVAGLLGLFLGSLGIHNFYLGNSGRGVAQIIVTIVTCGIGSIWGFIEGIMILAGSINVDANGVPLKD